LTCTFETERDERELEEEGVLLILHTKNHQTQKTKTKEEESGCFPWHLLCPKINQETSWAWGMGHDFVFQQQGYASVRVAGVSSLTLFLLQ
jgi:hypothetical protein